MEEIYLFSYLWYLSYFFSYLWYLRYTGRHLIVSQKPQVTTDPKSQICIVALELLAAMFIVGLF